MRYIFGVLFACFSYLQTFATHIEAGEITYRQLNGFTYEATLVLYVLRSSNVPGNLVDGFNWGDGTVQTLTLSSEILLSDNLTQKRTYIATHTYPGPSRYLLSLNEQFRINSIQNINNGNGVNVAFYLESELIINPFNPVGSAVKNNSPILINPPLDKACIFQPFEHNPAAYDIDGDSLSYQLVPCRGQGGVPIVYVDPDQVNPGANNQISIDPVTGTVSWTSAQLAGIYNIAILITEWRGGQKVGSVLRDMQIKVVNCANRPPFIRDYGDTCVAVNSNINKLFEANDGNNFNDNISITASGETFERVTLLSSLSNAVVGNPASVVYNWIPTCAEARRQPYEVVLKATDDGNLPLADYGTWRISVVLPPVTVYPPQVQGGRVQINWDASICNNVDGYRVYRSSCTAGAPNTSCSFAADPRFQLVGTVQGSGQLKYIDTTLTFSTEACYIVVPFRDNGAEGIASVPVCVESPFQEICMVSVGRTDAVNGLDTIKWNKPIDIDTLTQYTGPYQYRVYRSPGITKATNLVYQTPISIEFYKTDTVFIDSALNTIDSAYTYLVELYSGNALVGNSSNASSIFLRAAGSDRKISLTWTSKVPWTETGATVQRFDTVSQTWVNLVSNLNDTMYADTSAQNGFTYCYRIVRGTRFCDPARTSSLMNFSQEVCATAVDQSAPPIPVLSATPFCKDGYAELTWAVSSSIANADLKSFIIFYKPSLTGDFTPIATLDKNQRFFFYTNNNKSITGCYAIGTEDTLGNTSGPGPRICLEDCPEYRLPNVFTPNGDGVNDVFTPFPYNGVTGIELQIFNRWGKMVFQTTNPDILWDGRVEGANASDGVYFYVGTVFFGSSAGPKPVELKGTVTLFTSQSQRSE
ncbi:MAG TPA: gliding motility-associated C-terminal domain-containing protein [Luteibaculaceae bacterium]|nr:gliding motility-associated C-terminal domain-containing protein [Luteibaculaceae bacterium]